ncbi:glutathione S-transferase family protein [Alsobacter sp. KACC 23698]|uniref:Glutathione S-transferase family protein n=1 Tax=Alsobacter sp. KACC 23698 TaxID=3149229 RepID=A0AAU7JAS7_9HYPH
MSLKLYHSPGACSLAAHLVLEEVGATFEPVRVNFAEGEQRSPAYLALNPKGRVPALVDGDWVLTEVPAILRHVARTHPAAGLWPDDPRDEARCAEWLAWCSSTVHVAYAHVRRPERYASSDAAKAEVMEKGRETCLDVWSQVDARLAGRTFAAGDRLSVADFYVLVFWLWGRGPTLAFDMPATYPHWTAHARRLAERPAVRRVFEREGLQLP